MPDADGRFPVVIAGAGPVGLTLALALARYGVHSVVLEQKSELDPHSRAIAIFTRTLEILRALDVLPAFLEHGNFQRKIEMHSASSNNVALSFNFEQLAEQSPSAGVLLLPQDRTERLLLDAVNTAGLCDIRFDTRVVAITQNTDGVNVRVSSGESEHEITGD